MQRTSAPQTVCERNNFFHHCDNTVPVGMRWQVEVSTMGKDALDPYTVEADSWQRALQAARKLRGDESPMSGFSIELLSDGCRAVDPAARIRYDVKRAKDDAPLTPGAEGLAPAPRKAPRPADSKPQVAPAAAPAAAPAPTKKEPTPSEPWPAAQVISKREEEPSDSVPLSYREYAFLIAKGTSEDAAAQALLVQFLRVRKSLEAAKPGKLVNLAAFDEPFQGRPTVPPIATLTWKDWRGEPVVAFPRRDAKARTPAQEEIPTVIAPTPGTVSAGGTQPIQAPATFPEPPPSRPRAPTAGRTTTLGVAPAAQAAPAPVQAPVQVVVQVPVQQARQPTAQEPQHVPQPQVQPQQHIPPQPIVQVQPQPMVQVQPQLQPAMPVQQSSQQPLQYLPHEASHSAQIPGPPPSAPRVRGDELIADLFESMHDLHFQRDAVDAGDFVLGLALTKIPSRVGMVHFYDIDKREFVVGCLAGQAPPKLLSRRHPEAEALLNSAMRKRQPIVAAGADSRVESASRFALLGDVATVMTAPVMQSGRFLGAIELVDPADGSFDPSDMNALRYIADQFAEYLGQHGVVLDPERIAKRTPAP